MCKMPQNIKQIASISGRGRIDPLLGWKGCRKSLGIEGLNSEIYQSHEMHVNSWKLESAIQRVKNKIYD